MRTSPTNRTTLPLCQPVLASDALEARWAANAIANLARELPEDSVVAMVLRRTQQELLSLSLTGESAAEESKVIGPIRLRVAG